MHTNLESVRQLLESRLKEATQTKGSRESIRIQQVADPVDMTLQAAEREMAMQSLDRRAGQVRQLRSAIYRIEKRVACIDESFMLTTGWACSSGSPDESAVPRAS